jgi:hypothetical protein
MHDMLSFIQSGMLPQAPLMMLLLMLHLAASESDEATTTNSIITPAFWKDASKTMGSAGMSTPMPQANSINAPNFKPPKPGPWQAVSQDGTQPLDTKLGAKIMYGMSGPVTATPPPQQAAISRTFIAQCPMVLFHKNLSIRAPSCNDTLGQWVDPSPLNPRNVLRWKPLSDGELSFSADSGIDGEGSVLFADIKEQLTLTGYHFTMRNCLGVERWHIEENVFKVDSMGKVSSTMDLHDTSMNSEAFFIKYIIRTGAGSIAAETPLLRLNSNEVSFTLYNDQGGTEKNTGKVVAVAKRRGTWTKEGWRECMSSASPRGWDLYFPLDEKDFDASVHSSATVQDIRMAISGVVTLMAYRDEKRGADGINTQGQNSQMCLFIATVVLVFILSVTLINFCMVFRASGIKDKVKRIMFDSEGVLMPKNPYQQRAAPLHPCY